MTTATPTQHTSSTRSERSADEIWSLISDPSCWPEWNSAVESLTLDGPFVAGTTGILTPLGGSPLPFLLVEVRPGRGYTSETTIASTVGLRSSTRLAPDSLGTPAGGTVITQRSELVGAAAEHFAPAFGRSLVTGVDQTVKQLAGTTS